MQTPNLEQRVVAWMTAKLKINTADFWKIPQIQDFLDAVEHAREMEITFPENDYRFVSKQSSGSLLFQKGHAAAEVFKN